MESSSFRARLSTEANEDCFRQGKHAKKETKVDKRHDYEHVVAYFKQHPLE